MKPSKILHIVRGHSGSGKSTMAKTLSKHVLEADSYFYKNGIYCFDASKLKQAHAHCYDSVQTAMRAGFSPLAVANTFTRRWEYEPYISLAKSFGYQFEVHVCTGDYENIHNVPADVVEAQKNRFEV